MATICWRILTSTRSSEGPQVLCVEDDADLLDEIVDTLGERGCRVIPANNAIQAQRILNETSPDLVLCDIGMPGMTGYELLSWMRSLPAPKKNTPFVFLTAFAGAENESRGWAEGADDYLTKPVDFDRLAAIIEARVARVSSLRQELAARSGRLPRIIEKTRLLSARIDRELQEPVRRAAAALTRLELLSEGLDSKMQATVQEARQSIFDIAGRIRSARTLLQISPADALIQRKETTQAEIFMLALGRATYAFNENGIEYEDRSPHALERLHADADKLALALGNLMLYLASTLGSDARLLIDARLENETAVFDLSSSNISLESLQDTLSSAAPNGFADAAAERANLPTNPIDLGMVVAHELFVLHDGEITALPRLGGGAVLRATIPWN